MYTFGQKFMRGPIYFSLISLLAFGAFFAWRPMDGTNILAPKNETAVCKVYVPNAFSPDGDGVNDEFLPASNCVLTDYRMQIFSREGSLVFQTTNPSQGWNGKYRGQEAASTAYLYAIEYTITQQDTIPSFPEMLTGAVALVR